MNSIELSNIKWEISNHFAVRVPHLILKPNVYHIAGENGSGKSILLVHLAKLIQTSDEGVYNPCEKILYLTNEDITFPNLKIGENLALNQQIFGISLPVDDSLFSQEQLDTLCKEASLGMRQKVGLSLILNKNFWDLIILDETLSNLDHDSKNRMLRTLEERSEEGTIVLLVDHQLDRDKYKYKYHTIRVTGGVVDEEG